ncbi:hypothetical protein Q3G72_014221 [Acer saccharum]|nr:hypothetical protein Q3G72_014221 [Acer saccharum]
MAAWFIWHNRNQPLFRGKVVNNDDCWDRAENYIPVFQGASENSSGVRDIKENQVLVAPRMGAFKINVDAAMRLGNGRLFLGNWEGLLPLEVETDAWGIVNLFLNTVMLWLTMCQLCC